jgi:hypothetical protein
MVNDSASCSKTSARAKAPIRRRDTRLEQLEALHKSSETGSRLRIPDGKRIKLSHDHTSESIQPASKTMKNLKGPKFDLDFSVLEEDNRDARETGLIELSDSEELPEPHELVRTSIRSGGEADESLASRASDYSDSDMDALIREAHLDGITSTRIDTAYNQDISASGSTQGTLEYKEHKEEGCTVSINARTGASASTEIIGPRLPPQVRTHRSRI